MGLSTQAPRHDQGTNSSGWQPFRRLACTTGGSAEFRSMIEPSASRCGSLAAIAPKLVSCGNNRTLRVAAQHVARRGCERLAPIWLGPGEFRSLDCPYGHHGRQPSLRRRQVHLDGTVDASAIYLHGVTVKGSKRDVFFVTTNCGKTIALDANGDAILWEYTPPQFSAWVGTAQITNSTPVADADRLYVYAAAPDGTIQKLAISDGQVLWTTPITLLTQREKIASPLKVFRGRIVAVTAGYNGRPTALPGHVAILDAQSGKLLHVWNSLCSDRAGLIQPGSRQSTRSAIWGRAGAVIDEGDGQHIHRYR